MSGLRVAIDVRCIQDRFPGIGRYCYNLVRALTRVSPQCSWSLVHNPSQVQSDTRFGVASLAALPGVSLVATPENVFSIAEQTRLPGLARRLGVDAWHAPYYVMPYRMDRPVMLTFYDAIAHRFPETLSAGWKHPLFEAMTRLAVRAAGGFVAISAASRDDLVHFYEARPELSTVTPLGVDDRFHPRPAAEVAGVVARLGLPREYVLYLGSNKPHKNLPRLVEAWLGLARERRVGGRTLVVAGEWDARFPAARRAVEASGLAQSVHFAGPVAEADLPALYSGARCFVFPSMYEGFGLPVLEAMACGTPVVCSNISSLPEIAADSALLVDPMSVPALAEAIVRVLADSGLGHDLSGRGQVRAAGFTWERTAQLTMAAYERLAGGRA